MLGKTEHLGQAEPGALADLLGGEERLEDAPELVLRNSDAGILDRHRNIAVRRFRLRRGAGQLRHAANRDRQPAFAIHGVARIDRHVDQRGLELAGIGVDQAGAARHTGDDLDPRAGQGPDDFAQRLHVFADVEQFGLQRLPAREGQQLSGQFGGAVDGIRNRLDIAQPPLLGQLRPPQHIDGSPDHGEEIVEVMGDAAGELSERFEALPVLQRLLGLHAPVRLGMKVPGPPQRQRQNEKQQGGGRQAEDQVLAHGGEPARPDRRRLESGADIDRIGGKPLVPEPALDPVGLAMSR